MTATVDLTIPQGTSWAIGFPLLDEDSNPIIDTTGWSARAQVRPTRTHSSVLFEWSSEGDKPGRIVFENGVVNLYVRPEHSSAWVWTRGVWDLEITDADGDVFRPVGGHVWVDQEVTR